MTLEHVAWLELAVAVPLAGAVFVRGVRGPAAAAGWCAAFAGAALGCVLMAAFAGSGEWLNPLVGRRVLAADALSTFLLTSVAVLHFMVALTTPRAKVRPQLAGLLFGDAVRLATFACPDPTVLVVLLGLGVLPPYFDLAAGGKPTRLYAIHMGLFVLLLAVGLGTGSPELLLAAAVIRCGVFPLHVWVTDLVENAHLGGSLLAVTPLVGVYAAARLALPAASADALQVAAGLALFTAVYAAGMAVVQADARRFFAFLFLSHASLVLFGLLHRTPVGATGALALWAAGVLSLGGLGLALRAAEARFGRLPLTAYRGLYQHSPALAVYFLVAGLAGVGFPGSPGFVAAELTADAAVGVNPPMGFAVAAAAALSGVAVLRAYLLLFTGAKPTTGVDLGVTPREKFAAGVLAVLILGGGLVPQPAVSAAHRAATALLASRAAHGEAAHP